MAEFVILGTSDFFTSFLIAAGLFVVALLLIESVSGRPKPLNRFGFGVVYLLSTLALNVVPSLFVSVAAEDADTAAIVFLAVTAIFMALLAYAARRRAFDAYGDTGNAFMAAIPIVCLVLIFKKPEDRTRIHQRTKVALTGRVLAFTVAAFALVVVGSFFRIVLDSTNRNAFVNVANLPIGRAVRIQAAILNANAPQPVGSETTLMTATANGNTLLLNYYLTGSSADLSTEVFEPLMSPIMQRNVCSDPLFRDLADRGAKIVFEYTALSQNQTSQSHRLETAATDCQ
ncbi:hypothetical protein [Lentibacter sp.]|uniref:hypothetical protein n=1 Tax=Lentibacter sp. TaxID=2024994 RepID=UPI003F6D01F1